MSYTECEIVIGSIYARMGLELEASNLIDKETWSPMKRQKDWDSLDADVVRLWGDVVNIVWNTPVEKMRAWAKAGNEAVEKLPEGEREANQLLLCVHMLDKYVSELGCQNFFETAMLRQKLQRIKWEIIDRVRVEGGDDLAKKTFIAADNLYRAIIGRPVIDTSTREKYVQMVIDRLKGKR